MSKQDLKDAFYAGKMYGISEQGSKFPCFDDWYLKYLDKQMTNIVEDVIHIKENSSNTILNSAC